MSSEDKKSDSFSFRVLLTEEGYIVIASNDGIPEGDILLLMENYVNIRKNFHRDDLKDKLGY